MLRFLFSQKVNFILSKFTPSTLQFDHKLIFRPQNQSYIILIRRAYSCSTNLVGCFFSRNFFFSKGILRSCYLYGSYSKGTATAWSDIDLAIVSPDFSQNLFEDQIRLLRLAAQIDDRIEARPFTPDRFNMNEPLVYEILQSGLKVS